MTELDNTKPESPVDDGIVWDGRHATNNKDIYCYCGGSLGTNPMEGTMITCEKCHNWFHPECLKSVSGPHILGDFGYAFVCSGCSGTGVEKYSRTGWKPDSSKPPREKGTAKDVPTFSVNEVVSWVQRYVVSFFGVEKEIKNPTVAGCLSTHSRDETTSSPWFLHHFASKSDIVKRKPWGLLYPNWFFWLKWDKTVPETIHNVQMEVIPQKKSSSGIKRQSTGAPKPLQKKSKKIEGFFTSEDLSHKKAPSLPANPGGAVIMPTDVTPVPVEWLPMILWKHDSAPLVQISRDGLTVKNDNGYRTARPVYGVSKGWWYYEVTVGQESNDVGQNVGKISGEYESATRLGFSTECGDLHGPVGMDPFGYSYCSRHGRAYHDQELHKYGLPFAPGDVVGCMIRLKSPSEAEDEEPWKQGKVMLPICGVSPLANPSAIVKKPEESSREAESEIEFFLNGQSQGVAFRDMYGGTYKPAVSMFMNAEVTVNFGPEFKYPPNNLKVLNRDEEGNPIPEPSPSRSIGPGMLDTEMAAEGDTNLAPKLPAPAFVRPFCDVVPPKEKEKEKNEEEEEKKEGEEEKKVDEGQPEVVKEKANEEKVPVTVDAEDAVMHDTEPQIEKEGEKAGADAIMEEPITEPQPTPTEEEPITEPQPTPTEPNYVPESVPVSAIPVEVKPQSDVVQSESVVPH